MSQRNGMDRVLQLWMADGPTVMPDRVIDVIADRISGQPQRRRWSLRLRPYANQLRFAAALAAVVVIAIAGYNLLPGRPNVGGPFPSPSPSPTAPPVSSGPLEPGRYQFNLIAQPPFVRVLADVPGGWQGVPPNALQGPDGYAGPAGISLGILRAEGLFSDPCHWDAARTGVVGQPGDIEVGATAIDLVDALRVNPAYASTTPTPVTFGRFEGYQLDIEFPAELEDAVCDRDVEGLERLLVFSGPTNPIYVPGIRDLWRIVVVDVDDVRVVVTIPYFEATPEADLLAAQSIVDSFEFLP